MSISATCGSADQDLEKLVADGKFREDLFRRINVIPIHLPPFKDRREDIPLLAERFLAKFAAQMEKPVRSISREATELLQAYSWPGNVRELENAIERAVALEQTPAILAETLPLHVRRGGPERGPERGTAPVAELPEKGIDLKAHVESIYREHIAQALKRAGGVHVRTAEMLGMSFRSFRYYARKFNIR